MINRMKIQEGKNVENQTYHEKVLAFALDFGKKLLESGYEIMKTQKTMEILCRTFEAEKIDIFVIPSEINATIKFQDGNYISQMRAIENSSTNLYLIEKLNALSRKICLEKIPLEEAEKMFQSTIKLTPYKEVFNSIGAGLGTSGFAMFFGGTILDGLCAFLIGFIAYYIFDLLMAHFSKVSVSFMVSFIDGVIAVILYKFGLCNNLDVVMIGAIMTIIPGMALGNSVKDLLIGNTISGILTLINAGLIAVAVASGLALSIAIFMSSFVNNLNANVSAVVQIISGAVGTLGFGLLFSVDKKKLPIVSIGGLITTVVLIIAEKFVPLSSQYYMIFINIIASAFAVCLAEILARIMKAPTAIFLLPFLIPLVPGGMLYRTMYCLVKGDYTGFTHFLNSTLDTGLGIAVGIVLFGIIFRIVMYVIRVAKQKIKKTKTNKN